MSIELTYHCDNCGKGATEERTGDYTSAMKPKGWHVIGKLGKYGWRVLLCPDCLALIPAIARKCLK